MSTSSDTGKQDNEIDQIQSPERISVDASSQSESPYQGSLVAFEETFLGPLPPPETLAQYEQVLPGSAERIMVMAENQAEHRQSLEETVKTVIEGDSKRELKERTYGRVVWRPSFHLYDNLRYISHLQRA